MSTPAVSLRGIAWNHTRGYLPMVATAQRFEELHPDISIHWQKRSLQSFADASMADLAATYDLIVMDHPHTALAASQNLLLPFDDWLPNDFLADQAGNSVGQSHNSYRYEDRQWALATDAAAPIATYRPDLLSKHGVDLPKTWADVLTLAEGGYVTVSAFPVDLLMHTYMFCAVNGATPFTHGDYLASEDHLTSAIEELRRLVSLCDPTCFERNPIRTAEWMSSTDDPRAAYCPFAYGYSNYSRAGYARYPLEATGLVTFSGHRLRSTLGGAGLAVSMHTKHPRACMDYAQFVASRQTQCGIYFNSGGQPGHRAAWTDKTVNSASANFFRNTLPTLDEALVRGKFPGYMRFQDEATPIVASCIRGASPPEVGARRLNSLYRECYSEPSK